MKKIIVILSVVMLAGGVTTAFAAANDTTTSSSDTSEEEVPGFGDETSSPGTWMCQEIDIQHELAKLQERIAAADAAGDVDGAAMLRADEMALLACL